LEIKQLLTDYFTKKVDDGVDELFEKHGWRTEKIDEWLGKHSRTTYEKE
jgi:hypothetical protein